jgi:hypothetical protein
MDGYNIMKKDETWKILYSLVYPMREYQDTITDEVDSLTSDDITLIDERKDSNEDS